MTRPERKINFAELAAAIEEQLQAKISRSSIYKQSGGIGDERENAIKEVLKEILPERFGVEKGAIFDCTGNVTKELDIIIFEKDSTFHKWSVGGRTLIPIEAVYGTIEVKSKLDKSEYEDAREKILSVNPLKRFYKFEDSVLSLTPEKQKELEQGIPANGRFSNVGIVWHMIVAFDSVDNKTLAKYLESAPEELVGICVVGKQYVIKTLNPKGFRGAAYKKQAFGLAAWFILGLLMSNKRTVLFRPNVDNYSTRVLIALGDKDSWVLEITEEEKK